MQEHLTNPTYQAVFDFTISKMERNVLIDMYILIGVAHTSNPISQQFVVEENAFPVLIQLLRNHPSPNIKVYKRF